MAFFFPSTIGRVATGAILSLIAACAFSSSGVGSAKPVARDSVAAVDILNRVTWGVNVSTLEQAEALGMKRYMAQQLHPEQARLPAPIQAQINAMTITQRPLDQLARQMELRRKESETVANDEDKKIAQQGYQRELNRLAREAATRFLLRSLYSQNQLQEQMTWFWMNHFNVHQGKHNLRAMVGDYEESAMRAHALGKFRDLLVASAHHPAMLRYLDNDQNSATRINENYARELMELHTLGVDGGYSQSDVQELARILTGVGINLGPDAQVRPELLAQYVHRGLFEFNPNRHDYGDKQFLGQVVRGRGLAELDVALDRLSRHPATAHFVSRKLAMFLVADEPPAALVARMADTFLHSDGDIAATLQTLFDSPEFVASLGRQFKDPLHYVVSAVRLAYDNKPIRNAGPMLNWLNRMGEPLYGHASPDGYPMLETAWASPGQMTNRFDVAKAIGSGSAGLFKDDGAKVREQAAFPQLANALYFQSLQTRLGAATRSALDQAGSPQEWNTFLLCAPESMYR